MFLRALAILVVVVAASLALTWYLGAEVLLALGLILTQIKIIAKKLTSVELPAILAWLKAEASTFLRIELLKKWATTSLVPLLVGGALLRRIERWTASYKEAVIAQYEAMFDWYRGLEWYEKTVAALIVLFLTLALTVSSLGLWLILFSVKLPFWVIASLSALGRMIWQTIRKSAFKTVAFLQLSLAWRFLRRRLPKAYLERKRRFDFRVARMVVRRRRMTVRQLAEQKDSLSMRWSLWRESLRQERPAPPTRAEMNEMRAGDEKKDDGGQ